MFEGNRGTISSRRGSFGAVRLRVIAGLALGVGIVGLAGCTSGDENSPSTASASTSSAHPAPAPSSASAIPATAFDEVLSLVVERLATGDSVAASKLFSGQPVTDAAREKAVLDSAAVRAAEVGADSDYVSMVFTDQITASKEVQQSLLDAWAAGDAVPPTTAPDLATEVRPILDRITQSLVPALGAVEKFRDDPGCDTAVAASAAVAASHTTASPTALAALPTATADLCG